MQQATRERESTKNKEGESTQHTPREKRKERAMRERRARDLARDHIRCGCIAPGLFLTPMFEGLGEEVCETLAKDVIFPKRLGNAEEFAQYAVQIVENKYINGSVLRLDGGIRLA